MATTRLTATDRVRFRAAREGGKARAQDPAAPIDARYDRRSKAVILTFGSGASMTIPRHLIPGLERGTSTVLETLVLSPARDALRWPLLDADVHVPGLVERAFGSRLFAVRRRGSASVAGVSR